MVFAVEGFSWCGSRRGWLKKGLAQVGVVWRWLVQAGTIEAGAHDHNKNDYCSAGGGDYLDRRNRGGIEEVDSGGGSFLVWTRSYPSLDLILHTYTTKRCVVDTHGGHV